jgi:hypothetical protein
MEKKILAVFAFRINEEIAIGMVLQLMGEDVPTIGHPRF